MNQRVQQTLSEDRLESRLVIGQLELEICLAVGIQRQRVIGPLDQDEPSIGVGITLRPHLGIQRCTIEYDQAFKQRLPRTHLRPALHFHQRRLIMRPNLALTDMQCVQPGAQGCIGWQLHAHRQRIDQATDHVRSAVNTTGTSGAGGPKDHVRCTGPAAEQERPGALYHCVE